MTLTYARAATRPNCRPTTTLDAGYRATRRDGVTSFETLYCVTADCGVFKADEMEITPLTADLAFNDTRHIWVACDDVPADAEFIGRYDAA